MTLQFLAASLCLLALYAADAAAFALSCRALQHSILHGETTVLLQNEQFQQVIRDHSESRNISNTIFVHPILIVGLDNVIVGKIDAYDHSTTSPSDRFLRNLRPVHVPTSTEILKHFDMFKDKTTMSSAYTLFYLRTNFSVLHATLKPLLIKRPRLIFDRPPGFFNVWVGLWRQLFLKFLTLIWRPGDPCYSLKIKDVFLSFHRDSRVEDLLFELHKSFGMVDMPVSFYELQETSVNTSIYVNGVEAQGGFLSNLGPWSSFEIRIGEEKYIADTRTWLLNEPLKFHTMTKPIEIKRLNGSISLSLFHTHDISIAELKWRVFLDSKIPAAEQSLVYNERILQDHHNLSEYDIPDYGIIYLIQRSAGGGRPMTTCKCRCTQHASLLGCCPVCRIRCKCAECVRDDINALPEVKVNKDKIQAGVRENDPIHQTDKQKEEAVFS